MPYPEPPRPDPDQLLDSISRSGRGKLKIFFGANAGVGKTYAMLQDAQRRRLLGEDVLVGIVETHGRQDTEALISPLNILARRKPGHQRRTFAEFDLDAALLRKPTVILLDELAHSNAPGSRHRKRWQDMEELLDAGIDVLTTLNVQHLESLNDVVGGITGIQVRETVPDPIFDAADDVVLVDLPPEDLRQRLREGKIYLNGQAERAIEHFFRKGNLIALRELALRRMADRVDDEVRAFRQSRDDEPVWHTRDAVLLCLGPGRGNQKLVRTAARLAARLGSEWHAVYVETQRLGGLPESRRRAILRDLKMAQDLGAETATLSDKRPEPALVRYARQHNLGKIVIGRRGRLPRLPRADFARRLGSLAPELDIFIIGQPESAEEPVRESESRPLLDRWRMSLRGAGVALALCALITLPAQWLLPSIELSNLVMVYLLAVVIVALFYGRWSSVFSAVINVASFDLFFVQPRGSLGVSNIQYLLTFAVMLAVGIIVGNLTAGVRYQARIARYREQRARQLYEMSKALSQALTPDDIARTALHFVGNTFQARLRLYLAEKNQLIDKTAPVKGVALSVDPAIVRWSFDRGMPSGVGTDTLPGLSYQLWPVSSDKVRFGVLVIEPKSPRQLLIPEQQRLLETCIVLIAGALERFSLADRAEQARLAAEREQLRNALLAALSHDLRTPLTVLFGQAEILTLDLASAGSPFAAQANEIRSQVLGTTRLVHNLLDMARLQSGGFSINSSWQSLEEMIGSALRMMKNQLANNTVILDLPDHLQLVNCDSTLLERVFINLLENAIKYAGTAAQITLRARTSPGWLAISVEDDGPGIPPGAENQIFDKFTRGHHESAIPGVGLGLAICQAIVDLHQGHLGVRNRSGGGAIFTLSLPLGEPPPLLLQEEE